MPYVEASTIIATLGLPSSQAMEDKIGAMLEALDSLVDQACAVDTFADDEGGTRLFNGTGNSRLYLNNVVLRTFTKVEWFSVDGTVSDEIDYVAAQPSTKPGGFYRYLECKAPGAVFPSGVQNIRVTGDWGFETLPKAIEHAIAYAAKSLIDEAARNYSIKRDAAVDRAVEYIVGGEGAGCALPGVSLALLRRYTVDDMRM